MTSLGSGSPYYRPSGQFNVGGPVIMLGVGVVAGIVLGAAYGYLIQYNPLIYVNFLATLGFGGLMGVAASVGIAKGRVRAPALATLLGVVVGVIGLYAHWVFWAHALTLRSGTATWVVNPLDMWSFMQFVADNGAWSIKGYTPTGGVLYALWAVEALVIVGLSAFMCRERARTPYCETCHEWANDVFSGLPIGQPADPQALRSQLEAGNIAALKELPAAEGNSYCEVEHSVCPNCGDVGFLTIESVQVKQSGKGKGKGKEEKKKTDLVRNLTLQSSGITEVKALAERAIAAAESAGDPEETG